MGIRLYLAMMGKEIAGFDRIPEHAAWMLCPFSENPEEVPFFQMKGDLLVLTDAHPPLDTDWDRIFRKLQSLSPGAILLDFQRKPDRTGLAFVTSLYKAVRCPVIRPGEYGDDGPVFLPPVPLHTSLENYIAPWKAREIWLDLSPEGEKITLRETGAVFEFLHCFSPPRESHQEEKLHCHYTISLEKDAAVFTLWRTEADVMDLLHEAETLGIQNAIGLYQEWQGSGVFTFRGEI